MALKVTAQVTGQFDDFKTWGPVNTKIVIDILLEEVKKGSMEKGPFNTKRWRPMLQEVCARTKKEYSMDQLKRKFNILRLHHRVFSKLIEHTAFSWDPVTNNVTAPHECWDNYLKAHPDARRFRKKGLDHYKELGIIFNNSTATGMLRRASTQSPPNSDDMIDLENPFMKSGVHVDVDNYGVEDDGLYETQTKNVPEKSRESVGGGKTKRKRSFLDEKKFISDAFSSCTAVKARAERYQLGTIIECPSSEPAPDYSIGRCVRELDGMKFVDMPVYVKAIELFMKVEYREAFLSMAAEKRLYWLTALYNADS